MIIHVFVLSSRWVMAVDHASSSLLVELEDEHGQPLTVTADGNDRAADRERERGRTQGGMNFNSRVVEYVSTSIDDHHDQEENSSRRRKIRYVQMFVLLLLCHFIIFNKI